MQKYQLQQIWNVEMLFLTNFKKEKATPQLNIIIAVKIQLPHIKKSPKSPQIHHYFTLQKSSSFIIILHISENFPKNSKFIAH